MTWTVRLLDERCNANVQNEWRKFVSRTCPGPRSAHAVVSSPVGGGKLFLFGTLIHPQLRTS